MTAVLFDYLEERKQTRLEKRLKGVTDEDTAAAIRQEEELRFSLPVWAADAAKRAKQLPVMTHPSKFSHTSAKTSPVIAAAEKSNDGYVRSGNVAYPYDASGSAAAMDVYKFLFLPLSDGKTALEHFEAGSTLIRAAFAVSDDDYAAMRAGFLAIKGGETAVKTDARVKQVYFPIDNGYHLLSILTPSGLGGELKTRIDDMRFSDTAKTAREDKRQNRPNAEGFDDIAGLTVMGYGGSKPQNISVLNSRNGGRAYLLPSLPPVLKKQPARLPTRDYFQQCLYREAFRRDFSLLRKLIKDETNNAGVRLRIRNLIAYMIEKMLIPAFEIRRQPPGWSAEERYGQLPAAQKLWLDAALADKRDEDDRWRKDIARSVAYTVTTMYGHFFPHALKMNDDDSTDICRAAADLLDNGKEFF